HWQFWRVRESEYNFGPQAALATVWQTLDARGISPFAPVPTQWDALSTWRLCPDGRHAPVRPGRPRRRRRGAARRVIAPADQKIGHHATSGPSFTPRLGPTARARRSDVVRR